MSRYVERNVRLALLSWERGRRFEDEGMVVPAVQSYTSGLGRFLSYVKLSTAPDLAPAYYAFGALGRETARLCARVNLHSALQNARMALAASHLADPTRGDVSLIERAAGDRRPVYRLTLDAVEQLLSPEARIAGAADARDLLASLLAASPGETRRNARGLWPIDAGTRFGKGPIGYWRQKNRYMQATLPGCAGLDEGRERRRLEEEADAIFAELRRVSPEFDPGARPDRTAGADLLRRLRMAPEPAEDGDPGKD